MTERGPRKQDEQESMSRKGNTAERLILQTFPVASHHRFCFMAEWRSATELILSV